MLLSLKLVLIFQTLLYLPLFLFTGPIAHIFSSYSQVIKWLTFYIIMLLAAYGTLEVIILLATSPNAYHRPKCSLVLNMCHLFLAMLPLAELSYNI